MATLTRRKEPAAQFCDRRCNEFPIGGKVSHFAFCNITKPPRATRTLDRWPITLGRCAVCLDNLFTLKPEGSHRRCPCTR